MASQEPVQEQEFTVRVPNNTDGKSYHVMKYNASLNIDFSNWTQVRMVRENNQKVFNPTKEDDTPKYGAGSAFGKDLKEEARRKKLGIVTKKYSADAQPWLLKIGGKTGRKYKGIREGGVTDNTTYYVFTHGKNGLVQAYPLSEWYNFTPIIRYKTLDADEAEEKFAQRGKILNKWAVMVNKKVKTGGEEEEADPDEDKTKKKGKDKKDFKVSDMDDWDDDEDGDAFGSESEKEKDDDDDDDKNKRSKDSKKKTKKKKDNDDEAFEDSDDGDDEGREVDYMSDESSDSEEELEQEANIKGVDQDEGLSKMLDSDSSSEEDEEKKKKKEEEDEEKKKKDEEGGGKKKGKGKGSKNNSRATTPTEEVDKVDKAEKRKAMVANILDPNAEPAGKKSRLESFGSSAGSAPPVSNNDAISEETVRRYLKRRPMTTTDLLKKFRSKRTGIQNAQLVQLLAYILKKINPHKQKVKGVTYLSLKDN